MKKSKLLTIAAVAVLLGIFSPATAHAAELKDADLTTVPWSTAVEEVKQNSSGESFTDFSFSQSQSYDSYDTAVESLAKLTVDSVADRKADYFTIELPFNVDTEKN